MKLVLATHNQGKVSELRAIMAPAGFELIGFDGPEPVEDGVSFLENALIKARSAHKQTGLPAIADDSGLQVDILGGSPGIFTAVWSGTKDNVANRRLLLAQLKDIPAENRAASFVCTIALVSEKTEVSFTGNWLGSIAFEERGTNGHGYDPVFIPEGFDLTAAELEPEIKNSLSHRATAVSSLMDYLKSNDVEL
ncbi:MAG: RdgB/HAM1 family non-canonical purine NTP pyrophosphatase [Micrococcales bacterium]|nr:RdgB/HAM1 family non-canonical purine NTP pyrophosphatase [Micrococcales bacterium]NBR54743.1 RdgB/HAM1 family non-canonical purine NTP pyrophosphatase [Micrococcales bacterium]NBR60428.1 RdgB/HAM1 family non-canonical purine NTP pyrophosphatase [Actinomycetota bacterium]NBY44150.1 RdgB/HAM1 family non-canonical purine NTP pyrophosphatase [Micrococcales bacterium]